MEIIWEMMRFLYPIVIPLNDLAINYKPFIKT